MEADALTIYSTEFWLELLRYIMAQFWEECGFESPGLCEVRLNGAEIPLSSTDLATIIYPHYNKYSVNFLIADP